MYSSFNSAKEGDTTFIADNDIETAVEKVRKSRASKIYIHNDIARKLLPTHSYPHTDKTFIASENPRLAFIEEIMNDNDLMQKISSQYLYSHVSSLLRNNDIHPSCLILENVSIMNTTMKENCVIYPNTSIGFPALAVERDKDNQLISFPHIGRVYIQDNVKIGTQCNISRGSLEDTIIGSCSVIDDHVHIAHNCIVGKRNQITAGAVFGGSAKTGDDCWIGLGAVVLDHTTIGNNVLVAAGATVTKDVQDRDIVAGTPAKSIKSKCTISVQKRYHMVGY